MRFTINYLDDSKTLVNNITTAFLVVKTPIEECFPPLHKLPARSTIKN